MLYKLPFTLRSTGSLLRCLRCPTAYHSSDVCLAAGSERLPGNAIVCSRHLTKSTSQQHVNVNWCFLCSKGQSLLESSAIHSVIHSEHLCSTSTRNLCRGAPGQATAKEVWVEGLVRGRQVWPRKRFLVEGHSRWGGIMKRPSAVLQNRAHWLKSSTCGSAEFDVLRGQTHVDKGQTGWSTTRKTLPNKFSNFEGE